MLTTRRAFLQKAALMTAAVALAETPGWGQAPRVRHSVATPEGRRMLEKYARAVGLMQSPNRPHRDPMSWTFQWYTHAVPGDKAAALRRIFGAGASPAKSLAADVWSTCQPHFSGMDIHMFLPWHRIYLLAFEQVVRDVLRDSDFTLPYWDYTDPQQLALPQAFRMRGDALYGSLYRANRTRNMYKNINAGDRLDEGFTRNPFTLDDLHLPFYEGSDGFCRMVEVTLHGNVHTEVGDRNNMGSVPTAAGDPVFWLHHCNVDRIWAGWNASGGVNPASERPFQFAGAGGNRLTMKVSEVASLALAAYSYDAVPTFRLETLLTTPVEGGARSDVVATSEPVTILSPRGSRIALDPAPDTLIVSGVAGMAQDPDAQLTVVVPVVGASRQPGTIYEVFLDLPENATAEAKRERYLGSLNFFSAEGAGEPGSHGAPVVMRFNATAVARRLSARGQLSPFPAVSILPTRPAPADARPAIGKVELVRN
jgi:tyrosinase